MKKILYVLLDQWADFEAAYISSAINMLGGKFENKTVSLTMDPVTSIGGFRAVPDYDTENVPDDYEALILIGGMSWRKESAQKVVPLVKKCLADKKILGAICDATVFLGKAGFLNSVNHTSNSIDILKAWAGDAYTNEKNYKMKMAVRDSNIITANGTASLEFAREVMLAVKAADEADIILWYNFHKNGIYNSAAPKM